MIAMNPVTFFYLFFSNYLYRGKDWLIEHWKKLAESINQSCATVVILTNVCKSHFLCGSGAFVKGKQRTTRQDIESARGKALTDQTLNRFFSHISFHFTDNWFKLMLNSCFWSLIFLYAKAVKPSLIKFRHNKCLNSDPILVVKIEFNWIFIMIKHEMLTWITENKCLFY